jgi:metal-responsive CopG/Arc/MetJ family transcriptional regulator
MRIEEMVRIQLDMPDERVKELDALMQITGSATRKELFNNALTLLEWAVKERKQGRSIASVDDQEKKLKELAMPALENVLAASVVRERALATAKGAR